MLRAGARRGKAGTAVSEWGDWTPGNARAAQALLGPGKNGAGWRALLNDQGIILRGISDTRANRIGRLIADGAARGAPVSEIAGDIADVMGDEAWAQMVAMTELNRAMTATTLDTYTENGIERCEWSVADGSACEECADLDGETADVGDSFSTGDDGPPAHPNCGCVLLPVIPASYDGPDPTDEGDKAVKSVMPTGDAVAHALDVIAAITDDEPGKIPVPWPRRDRFDVPAEGRWTKAKLKRESITDLTATTKHLSRAKLVAHVKAYGAPSNPATVFPQVVKCDNGDHAIYEGHHRLAALWLLGVDDALCWRVKEKNLPDVTVPPTKG
jgi:SPP1 gp7 family putative phage head morphogenesis protein